MLMLVLYCTVLYCTVLIHAYCQVLVRMRPCICFQLEYTDPCVCLLAYHWNTLIPVCEYLLVVSTD